MSVIAAIPSPPSGDVPFAQRRPSRRPSLNRRGSGAGAARPRNLTQHLPRASQVVTPYPRAARTGYQEPPS